MKRSETPAEYCFGPILERRACGVWRGLLLEGRREVGERASERAGRPATFRYRFHASRSGHISVMPVCPRSSRGTLLSSPLGDWASERANGDRVGSFRRRKFYDFLRKPHWNFESPIILAIRRVETYDTHTWMYTYIHTYITCTNTHIYTYIHCMYTYTYIHTVMRTVLTERCISLEMPKFIGFANSFYIKKKKKYTFFQKPFLFLSVYPEQSLIGNRQNVHGQRTRVEFTLAAPAVHPRARQ